jgi:aspartate kinase
MKKYFNTKYNKNLTLLTIRHFTEKSIKETIANKKILMEQKNRVNAFFVIDDQT